MPYIPGEKIVDTDKVILYTVKDIQDIFKCGKKHAYEIVNAKGFPSIKMGGRFLVEKKALEKWLENYKGRAFII